MHLVTIPGGIARYTQYLDQPLVVDYIERLFYIECEGTRWAWYTLVQGHKQFILDQ
jgi:hypothetical protein